MDNYNLNSKKQNSKLKKQISFNLYMYLLLYTIIGLFIFMLISTITVGNNKLLRWINLRLDIIYMGYIIIGYCSIFKYYWNKPWTYLNEILEASEILYQENDSIIKLSEPLKNLETKMNRIKMSMILNKRIATELQYKKDELVMYLAHDIRTPLTSIIGYLSLLHEASEIEADKRNKYIKLTLEKSYRLDKLINEFFELTRYNSHQIELNIEKLDLYYLLLQLTDEFYPILSQNGNTIKLNVDENTTVFGDSIKLVRVFSNILRNASSYSFPNTEINITVKVINNSVHINFKNEGPTIPEDKLSQVFDKFYRGDDARTSYTGGAGLGLAIAKEIIVLHKGDIYVDSRNNIVDVNIIIPNNI